MHFTDAHISVRYLRKNNLKCANIASMEGLEKAGRKGKLAFRLHIAKQQQAVNHEKRSGMKEKK